MCVLFMMPECRKKRRVKKKSRTSPSTQSDGVLLPWQQHLTRWPQMFLCNGESGLVLIRGAGLICKHFIVNKCLGFFFQIKHFAQGFSSLPFRSFLKGRFKTKRQQNALRIKSRKHSRPEPALAWTAATCWPSRGTAVCSPHNDTMAACALTHS